MQRKQKSYKTEKRKIEKQLSRERETPLTITEDTSLLQ